MNALLNEPFDKTPSNGVFGHISRLLDLPISSERDALRAVTEGIPSRSYRRVAGALNMPADLVAPESTVRRRLASNSPFNRTESERLLRLARIYAEAMQLFGDEEAALAWLKLPADYLQDQTSVTPLTLAASDAGARLIEAQLRRTAYGML